jgi:hypothetical protein
VATASAKMILVNHRSRVGTLSKFVILFSVCLEAVLIVVACLASIGAASRDDLTDYETTWVSVVGTISLVAIFWLNLGFALIGRARKTVHLAIALTPLVAFLLLVLIERKFVNDRRHEFVRTGRLKYEELVNAIVKGDSNQFKELPLLGRFTDFKFEGSYGVDAETDADGAIKVLFLGRDHDPYAGYLYYTGRKLVPEKPNSDFFYFTNNSDPEFYFVQLTNNWYEYTRPSSP